MDNSLLDVRDINHKYIVVGRKLYQPVQSAVTGSREKICRAVQTERERGLYRDGNRTYNADAVGAYNILRKYHSVSGVKKELSVTGLKTPEIIKVAV